MSDIFREVDEEVRRERLKKLWERWGAYVVAGAVAIVVGVGGWRAWEWWEAKRAAEAGVAFEAALALAEADKHAEAEAAFAKLAVDAPSGYRILARFREAAEVALRDPQAAVKKYDALAADPGIGRTLQDLAAIRAALILVDTASLGDMQTRLEPLAAPDRPFRHLARELIVLSAWKVGDTATARRWFDMIVTDAETPRGTRARVEMLMALAGTEGKG